jgi:hypothetical protein
MYHEKFQVLLNGGVERLQEGKEVEGALEGTWAN